MSKITFILPVNYPVPEWCALPPDELGQLFDNVTQILHIASQAGWDAQARRDKIDELKAAHLVNHQIEELTRANEQLKASYDMRLKLKDDLLQQVNTDSERMRQEFDKIKMQTDQVRAEIEQRSNAQLAAQLEYSRRDIDRMHAQFERMHAELERKYSDQLIIQCANVRKDAELARQDMQTMRQDMQRMQQLANEQSGQTTTARETNALISQLSGQLSDTIAPIARFFGGTNAEKGISGEHIIYNILTTSDKYNDAVVEDVHGQAAHGDLIMRWRKLNCMIEIKNKQSLTNGDLDKFERDMRNLIQTRGVNCGVFISLQTAVFPGKTRELIQIELIDRVPVLYIYLANVNDLHYSIACLERLVSIGTTENEQVQRLTVHFNKYHEYLSNNQKYLNRTLADYKQMIRRTQEQLSITDRLYEQVSEDFKEFPARASPSAMADPEVEIFNHKPANHIHADTWPTDPVDQKKKLIPLITDHLLHCETPVNHANLGIPASIPVSIAQLAKYTEEVKHALVSEILTPQVIKQINDIKKKLGRQLTRNELVGRDMPISETGFRRLSSIMKLGRGTMAWVNQCSHSMPHA